MINFFNSDTSGKSLADFGKQPDEDFSDILGLFAVPFSQTAVLPVETTTVPEADFLQVPPNEPKENAVQPAILTTAGEAQNFNLPTVSKTLGSSFLKPQEAPEITTEISPELPKQNEVLSLQNNAETENQQMSTKVLKIPEKNEFDTVKPLMSTLNLFDEPFDKPLVDEKTVDLNYFRKLNTDSSLHNSKTDSSLNLLMEAFQNLVLNDETAKPQSPTNLFASPKEIEQIEQKMPKDLFASPKEIERIEQKMPNNLFASPKEIERIEQKMPNNLFASPKEIEQIEQKMSNEKVEYSAEKTIENTETKNKIQLLEKYLNQAKFGFGKENAVIQAEKPIKKPMALFDEVLNFVEPQTNSKTIQNSVSNTENVFVIPDKTELEIQINPKLTEFIKSFEVEPERKVLELRLHPAELGKLEITLEKTEAGNLNISFHTENEAVTQILGESFENLRESLQNSGWQIEKMDVSTGSLSSDSNHRDETFKSSQNTENKRFFASETEELNETETLKPQRLLSFRA